MEGILNDSFFLIIIKSGGKQISGMVINGRGQISLYLCTIFPNGKFRTILDITLDQHHAVRLTETFGRAVPGFLVHLHLFLTIARPIYVAFKSRSFQNTRCHKTFCFQNVNDLGN